MILAACRRAASRPVASTLGRGLPQAPRLALVGHALPGTSVRGAAAVSYPKTLSLRWDGLFVKCFIAAVLYFGPQDVAFLLGLGWIWYTKASTVSPKEKQADAEAAVEAFKAKKGLEDVKVAKGSRTWHLSL